MSVGGARVVPGTAAYGAGIAEGPPESRRPNRISDRRTLTVTGGGAPPPSPPPGRAPRRPVAARTALARPHVRARTRPARQRGAPGRRICARPALRPEDILAVSGPLRARRDPGGEFSREPSYPPPVARPGGLRRPRRGPGGRVDRRAGGRRRVLPRLRGGPHRPRWPAQTSRYPALAGNRPLTGNLSAPDPRRIDPPGGLGRKFSCAVVRQCAGGACQGDCRHCTDALTVIRGR